MSPMDKKKIREIVLTRIGTSPWILSTYIKGGGFRRFVDKVPHEMFYFNRTRLEQLAKPTEVDLMLRQSLWAALGRGMWEGRAINATEIYGPFCTYTHWRDGVLAKPRKLAWLLAPMWDIQP